MTNGNGHGHQAPATHAEWTDEQEKRRAKVAVLLAAKFTHQQIAERLEIAKGTVASDRKAIRQRWREQASEAYEEYAAEHLATLALVKQRLLPTALSGAPGDKVSLPHLDRLFAVLEREARMLGLDAPSRVEVTMRIEQVAKAIELVLVELDVDVDEVRPLLGEKLRELDAVTEN